MMLMINKAAITRKVAQRSISEIPVLKVYVLSTHYAKVAVIKTPRSCVSVCSVIIICKVAAITLNRQHLQQMIKTTQERHILQGYCSDDSDESQITDNAATRVSSFRFKVRFSLTLWRCWSEFVFYISTIDKMYQKDWSSFLWSKITQSEADG